MTLALSTSGAWAIVAVFDSAGLMVEREQRESRRQASGAILSALEGFQPMEYTRVVVDVGPGSFTGVRVGVTMAKMWAETWGIPLFGVSSFDLISAERVAIPSKKGEVFVRVPGSLPTTARVEDVDATIIAGEEAWSRVLTVLPEVALFESDSLTLAPLYVGEANISQAKQSHIMGETFGGRQDV